MTFRERRPEPGAAARLTAIIERLTSDLRTRQDGAYPGIRRLLPERGINPESALLVQLHSEDTNALLGIVVSPGVKIHLFMYDFLDTPIDAGRFREWLDLTGQPTHVEYRAFGAAIECGVHLLRSRHKPN